MSGAATAVGAPAGITGADAVFGAGALRVLVNRPVLSIVGFRYRPKGGFTEVELDLLNRQVVNRLVGRGAFFLAPTILKGRTAMRAAIVNFRTREDDLRALLDEAALAGQEILTG